MFRIPIIFVLIIIAAVVIVPNNIRAQNNTTSGDNETINAHTDKKSYVKGEDVVVSGKVSPVVEGERLRIDVYDPKGAVFSDNIGVAYFKKDGTFSTFFDSGLLITSYLKLDSVKDYGTYKATITYNGHSITIPFNVTPSA